MRNAMQELGHGRAMSRSLAWSDLAFEHCLGEGKAGSVWKATTLKDVSGLSAGSQVAVKRYKSWVLDQPGQPERLIRELEMGRQVQHPSLGQYPDPAVRP